MHRQSFAAGAAAALIVSAAAGWSAVQITQSASAAPDKSLGVALMSAVVRADGTLAHGSGVVSTSRMQGGWYAGTFERPVDKCSVQASPGNVRPNGDALIGIALVNILEDSKSFWVRTISVPGNALTDTSFHLLAYCPH